MSTPSQDEILQIFVGQCGVQIGMACWEMYCLEHGVTPDGQLNCDPPEETYSPLFETAATGINVPRTIMVDLEPTAINEIRRGPYKDLFSPVSLITGKEDASSIFARGYYSIGRELIELVIDRIRKSVDNCVSFQGFIIYRSLGGGTGSGFTNLILDQISKEYDKKPILEFGIYPSPNNSPVVLEPYNSILATHGSLDSINESLVFDNEALIGICDTKLRLQNATYKNLNRIIAQVASSVTSAKLAASVIPYPRLHHELVSFAPLTYPRAALYEPLSVSSLTDECFDLNSLMLKCDPRLGKYSAARFIYRGDCVDADVNNSINSIKANKHINFVKWGSVPFKVDMVPSLPPIVPEGDLAATTRSVCVLGNSSAVKQLWQRLLPKFDALLKRNAFVHSYLEEGMDIGEFQNARNNIRTLVSDYDEVDKEAAESAE